MTQQPRVPRNAGKFSPGFLPISYAFTCLIRTSFLLVTVALTLSSLGCSGSKEKEDAATATGTQGDEQNEPPVTFFPEDNSKAFKSNKLLDEISEAITMIETDPDAFLKVGFLHPLLRLKLQLASKDSFGQPKSGLMTKNELDNLKSQLLASLKADFKINDDKSVAVAHYKLPELKAAKPTVSKLNPFEDRKPTKAVSGLGGDLKVMLTKASALVEAGKLEEFVRSVYPIPDVARFEDQEEMQQHLERIKSDEMKTAMVKDLKEAAAATAEIQGDLATVKLTPLVDGDPDRHFKFEKVDGNWRFIDSDKQKRQELVKLATHQSAAPQREPTQGVIVFTRTESGWKMMTMPVAE